MFSRNIIDVAVQNELIPWFWPRSSGDFYTETNYSFPSTLDGDPVVKTFENFTIGPGAFVTVSNRCKGLYLNILGDCHIDGTLSMTARGAKGARHKYRNTSRIWHFLCKQIAESQKWYFLSRRL